MNKKGILIIFLLLYYSSLLGQQSVSVSSPDGLLKFELETSKEDINYTISYKNNYLIKDSHLGFNFKSGEFNSNLDVGIITKQKIDETYELVIGKVKQARDHCNQVIIPLKEKSKSGRVINLIVRAYNDGVAFRYEFPKQENWNSYVMYDERTQFKFKGNPKALFMYLPGYINTHEGLYNYENVKDIEENRLIEMPVTFEYPNGIYASVTEAAILNYAGMYLIKTNGGFIGKLSPKLGQEKIKVVIDEFPHRTPWRVIMVGDRIETLLETNILTSLNEPCKIENTVWLRPYSTTFTWWNGNIVPDTTFSPGNNFETNKYYIDFAARNGIDLHGIYGYAETPWYFDDNFNFGWPGERADVTRPIPCLDLPRISSYARSRGVGLHVWVHWKALYSKLEEAFAKYQKWGIKGLMIDFMDRNDQEMIQIQEEFLKMAAKYHLFVQFHGASKPSGLIRTYPNEFTREGTLNYEVYKWDTIINADHDISIPFTRMLAGSTDYHLGGFRAVPRSEFKIQYTNPLVTSTRCHMLAMYVVLENYLTSLCDHPMAYKGQEGFEFLRKVPSGWDEIKVPHAKFNEYLTIARRKGNDWWIGSLNNNKKRDLTLSLQFLDEGDIYVVEIYTDAADVDVNPNNLDYKEIKVTSKDFISLPLASDGGAAIHIRRTEVE
jgi:alpha-glucosidase